MVISIYKTSDLRSSFFIGNNINNETISYAKKEEVDVLVSMFLD